MIRRINHTGRRRIPREKVRIVVDDRQTPPKFTLSLDIADLKFNSDALIVVEAYRGSGGVWMSYDWGKVGAPKNPSVGTLQQAESVDGLLFRVRVVATHEPHKILGEADKVPFVRIGEAPDKRMPLIEVVSAQLGDLVWEIDRSEPPVLMINESLGNWHAAAKHRSFSSLVYPAVLQEMLTRLLLGKNPWTSDGDEDDWRCLWIRFAKSLVPEFADLDEDSEEDERIEFISSAVRVLATRIKAADGYRTILDKEG